MSYLNEDEYEFVILYVSQNSIRPYPVSPLSASVGSKPFAVQTRIFTVHKVLVNPRFYNFLHLFI